MGLTSPCFGAPAATFKVVSIVGSPAAWCSRSRHPDQPAAVGARPKSGRGTTLRPPYRAIERSDQLDERLVQSTAQAGFPRAGARPGSAGPLLVGGLLPEAVGSSLRRGNRPTRPRRLTVLTTIGMTCSPMVAWRVPTHPRPVPPQKGARVPKEGLTTAC